MCLYLGRMHFLGSLPGSKPEEVLVFSATSLLLELEMRFHGRKIKTVHRRSGGWLPMEKENELRTRIQLTPAEKLTLRAFSFFVVGPLFIVLYTRT